MVLIHASAIAIDGRAFIFLGPSETGKTTIARMFVEKARVQWISDDAVYMFQESGQWYVTNADSKAFIRPTLEQQRQRFGIYSLHKILRLYRSTEPRLEVVDDVTTCRYLTDAYFEINFHTPLTIQNKQEDFGVLAAIARTLKVEMFYFDLSDRTRAILG